MKSFGLTFVRTRFLPAIPTRQTSTDFVTSSFVSNLKARFPDSAVMSALSVLDPANMPEEFIFYGEQEMETLSNHFQLNEEDLVNEWMQSREIVHKNYRGYSLPTLTKAVHASDVHKESFPVLGKLLVITLTLPVSTADCERGFSEMKITKTELRNRTKKETLASLMHICTEGPHISNFDFCQGC